MLAKDWKYLRNTTSPKAAIQLWIMNGVGVFLLAVGIVHGVFAYTLIKRVPDSFEFIVTHPAFVIGLEMGKTAFYVMEGALVFVLAFSFSRIRHRNRRLLEEIERLMPQ